MYIPSHVTRQCDVDEFLNSATFFPGFRRASVIPAFKVAFCYKGRQGQDGLVRVWESEFRAENKGGPLSPYSEVGEFDIHILKS